MPTYLRKAFLPPYSPSFDPVSPSVHLPLRLRGCDKCGRQGITASYSLPPSSASLAKPQSWRSPAPLEVAGAAGREENAGAERYESVGGVVVWWQREERRIVAGGHRLVGGGRQK
ncbi:hypothetical protein OSB04_010348 [Centaurea solstitialis]|uniref:Uncharacterized protein n=1 Tax=Centaurea solstitialis TaxID=347529 RepID=A0AA38T7E4_9ASTR|nr:hypothetical protein OSB04_010348 [Centaurea solstitialis]